MMQYDKTFKEEGDTMTKLESYWITNKEWYDIDDDGNPFLTDKATPEAVESFKKYKQPLIDKKDSI